MLSLAPGFERQWHSLYKGLECGAVDTAWLSSFLAQQVSQQGVQYYALDGTSWLRPQAETLADRQYVYHPSTAVNGGTISAGQAYSCLDWIPEAESSWALGISVQRIGSLQTASEVGVTQILALSQQCEGSPKGLAMVAADAKYGNATFLRPLRGQACGLVVRARCDRVLYRAPEVPAAPRRGRPRVHGARFGFKEPETWGPPDEVIELQHPHLGQVRLERWNCLHGQRDPDVPVDVVRASIHRERATPPQPIWLFYQAPSQIPADLSVTAQLIWETYVHRETTEAGIRFRKQSLSWTTPHFQSNATSERWSWLVLLAFWLLYLSRSVVSDMPLPWQKPQSQLTPRRVQQSLAPLFVYFGSPVSSPKVRGKPPGWPKGRSRTPKPRCAVVKKQPANPKHA